MGGKEDMMRVRNGNVRNFALLAIGGLIGAGAAMLMAPQSGKQTRRDILHLGKVARNKSERVLLDVGRKTTRMVNSLSDRFHGQA